MRRCSPDLVTSPGGRVVAGSRRSGDGTGYGAPVTALPTGAYEHLVTRGLDERLGALDHDLAQRIALDPTDAHEVLSRHIGELARRALRTVSGRDALAMQVEVANQIAEAIRKLAPRAVDEIGRAHV